MLIISGGAETVAAAVAEAAWKESIPYHVIALNSHSLLKNAAGSTGCTHLGDDIEDKSVALSRLAAELKSLDSRCAGPVSIFPTEDDGLGLLVDLGAELPSRFRFSRASRLKYSGLDKAELADRAGELGISGLIAPTCVLRSRSDLQMALSTLGNRIIVKPSRKPWRSSLSAHGLKVLGADGSSASLDRLNSDLDRLWHLAGTWVAQPWLKSFPEGERSAALVGGHGQAPVELCEKWKFPRVGGSAVWVELRSDPVVAPISTELAEATGLVGICEMAFLRGDDDRAFLLEMNPRPWLQIELVDRAVFPIIVAAHRTLIGERPPAIPIAGRTKSWVQLERMALSIATGDAGPRLAALREAARAIRSDPVYAVYSTRMPGMKRSWTRKVVRRLLKSASFGVRSTFRGFRRIGSRADS